MTKSLIITADDYGLCAAVNRAIEECLTAGSLGAVCVMANMPSAGDAARLRRQFPGCSVGIHWNLTQGRPILPPAEVATLVDDGGNFTADLRSRWLARRVAGSEVGAELRAQYRRLRDLVGAIEFWNSHQNIDAFPGLFQLFVEVGAELQIAALRSHRRFTVPRDHSAARYLLRHPIFWLKGRLLARWSAAAQARGLRLPDGRAHLPGQSTDWTLLERLAERLPWQQISGAIEWVVHPATEADDPLLGALRQARRRDYDLLRQPALRDRLHNLGLRSVSFAALPAPSLTNGQAGPEFPRREL